jgi:signal transduction histidine kinase
MRDSPSNGLPECQQKTVLAHLAQDSGAGLHSANVLGSESLQLGLQTVDLANNQNEVLSEPHADELLQESRKLESHVQNMTRKILTSHEEERKRMSHELQNEIAQTLLGIHVRLLALRKKAANRSPSFAQEITMTQELIGESVKVIHRYALEIGLANEN